jgi:hypothetical protein
MIVRSFIIVDPAKYDVIPDVDLPENAHVAYNITSTSILELDTFYKKVFLAPKKYKFCLLIDLDNKLCELTRQDGSVLDFVVSFTFHSNYLKTDYDYPVVLFQPSGTNSYNHIPIIRETFKSHGYDDIIAMIMGKDDISLLEHFPKCVRFDLMKNCEGLPSKYLEAIKKVTSSETFFSFFLEYPEQLPALLNIIIKTESMICKDLPQVYCLLAENRSLNLDGSKLISRLQLLQEELSSLHNDRLNYYSTIARYKRQMAELMKFYKNEYEILPTWYKRLGHIVKVLMGKRTFRSLFDDKVKKYTD